MATTITGIAPLFDFTNESKFLIFTPYKGAGVNGNLHLIANTSGQGAWDRVDTFSDSTYDFGISAYIVTILEFSPSFRVFGTGGGNETGSGTFEVYFGSETPYKVSFDFDSRGFNNTVPQGMAITVSPCIGSQVKVFAYTEPKSPNHQTTPPVAAQILIDTTNNVTYTNPLVVQTQPSPTYGAVFDLGLQDANTTINYRVVGLGGVGGGDYIDIALTTNCEISCVPVVVSGSALPNGTTDVAYSHDISLTGTAPFTLSNIVKPAWASVTVVGNIVTISGTPTVAAVNETISFTVSSVCDSINFSDTIDIVSGCVAPTITTQPQPASNCTGASINIDVVAAGTGPLTYQWYKDTVLIAGANSSTYTVSATGNYYCKVSNACGNVDTNTVTVSIDGVPSITTHPVGYTGCTSPYALSVVAVGATSYQWYKDTNPIAGETGSTYNAPDSGTYYVVAINSCGGTQSNDAVVVINSVPVINSDPNPYTGCNTSELLQVLATGATAYQWQKDLVDIPGANSATYSATISGSYRVRAANACGSVYSAAVAVTFQLQPVLSGLTIPNATNNVAYSATINVDSGTAPMSLSSIVKPAWMTITLSGNTITFSGTPTAAATGVLVSFSVVNMCGSAAFNQTIDVDAGCVPVGGGLINGPLIVVPGNSYTYQITGLTGSGPFTYNAFVTGGTLISGNGTDTIQASRTANGAVVFEITNCSGITETRSIGVSIQTADAVDDAVITTVNTPVIFNLSANDIICT